MSQDLKAAALIPVARVSDVMGGRRNLPSRRRLFLAVVTIPVTRASNVMGRRLDLINKRLSPSRHRLFIVVVTAMATLSLLGCEIHISGEQSGI